MQWKFVQITLVILTIFLRDAVISSSNKLSENEMKARATEASKVLGDTLRKMDFDECIRDLDRLTEELKTKYKEVDKVKKDHAETKEDLAKKRTAVVDCKKREKQLQEVVEKLKDGKEGMSENSSCLAEKTELESRHEAIKAKLSQCSEMIDHASDCARQLAEFKASCRDTQKYAGNLHAHNERLKQVLHYWHEYYDEKLTALYQVGRERDTYFNETKIYVRHWHEEKSKRFHYEEQLDACEKRESEGEGGGATGSALSHLTNLYEHNERLKRILKERNDGRQKLTFTFEKIAREKEVYFNETSRYMKLWKEEKTVRLKLRDDLQECEKRNGGSEKIEGETEAIEQTGSEADKAPPKSSTGQEEVATEVARLRKENEELRKSNEKLLEHLRHAQEEASNGRQQVDQKCALCLPALQETKRQRDNCQNKLDACQVGRGDLETDTPKKTEPSPVEVEIRAVRAALELKEKEFQEAKDILWEDYKQALKLLQQAKRENADNYNKNKACEDKLASIEPTAEETVTVKNTTVRINMPIKECLQKLQLCRLFKEKDEEAFERSYPKSKDYESCQLRLKMCEKFGGEMRASFDKCVDDWYKMHNQNLNNERTCFTLKDLNMKYSPKFEFDIPIQETIEGSTGELQREAALAEANSLDKVTDERNNCLETLKVIRPKAEKFEADFRNVSARFDELTESCAKSTGDLEACEQEKTLFEFTKKGMNIVITQLEEGKKQAEGKVEDIKRQKILEDEEFRSRCFKTFLVLLMCIPLYYAYQYLKEKITTATKREKKTPTKEMDGKKASKKKLQ